MRRHAAQHREPRAHVLAALVVVGGGGQQRARPVGAAALHAAMEGVGVEGEGAGIEADIVARQQAAVAIEAGVLDRLGGDRRAELLEARHGAGAGGLGEPAQHGIDRPAVGREARAVRAGGGAVEHGAIGRREHAVAAVGAIDREVRQQLAQHAAQQRLRQLATREGSSAGVELGAKAARQNLAAGGLLLGGKVARPAAQRRPSLGQHALAARVVLQGADLVHEVVAGGAVAAPVGRQALAGQQDLLDHEVRAGFQACAQGPAVGGGIAEAVDMVDAQAIDDALGMQAQRQGMDGLEGLRLLHAQADQLVDVEEAPPVDAVAGAAPPGEPPVLALEAAVCGGQAMGKVAERLAVARELARGQDLVERPAEDRQQDLVVGLPVDVEPAGEAAGAAMAQHVGPPGVGGIGRHVVGHDVDDQPQARRCKRRRQGAQTFLAAQLGIDAGGVDHVVAVLRARPRRGDRRGVEMADAQPREIGHQGRGIGEGEAAMELQAQRGARGHRRWRRMTSMRLRTAGASNNSRAGGSRRRRQLGCSSIVPGRLGCSTSPSRSSSGASISGERDWAT